MNRKRKEKDLDPENWSHEGEFVYCRHDDCHFYKRHQGKKRRLLARFFQDGVQFKCDSCGNKSTYKFIKETKNKSLEGEWKPLEKMFEEWDGK